MVDDDHPTIVATTAEPNRRTFGFAMTGLGSVFLAGMAVLVRVSKAFPTVNAFHTTFFRFSVGGTAIVIYLLARGERLRIVNWRWLIARGVLGTVSTYIYFFAIDRIGLTKASILNFTYLAWVVVLSPLVLHERVTFRMWTAVGAAFLGVCLVVAPNGTLGSIAWEDLVALLGSFLAGLSILSTKRVRDTDTALASVMSLAVFGTLCSFVPAMQGITHLPIHGWTILVGIGLAGIAGKVMTEHAIKFIAGAEGAIWTLLVPVISGLMGMLLFHETMSVLRVIGSLVIVLSCGYVASAPSAKPSAQSTVPI